MSPVGRADLPEVVAFLEEVDLTRDDLDASTVRLWAGRDDAGRVVATTGYELGDDGQHALVRSVAVAAGRRSAGRGGALARYALDRAAGEGARRAWLFSRRSGPFWQALGFAPADRDELATLLAATSQVRSFRRTGQLDHEVAWSRPLPR